MERSNEGFSRRELARLVGWGVAVAGLPRVVRADQAMAATATAATTPAAAPKTAGVVRLNANENPLGPSAQALAAMQETLAGSANRYPFDTPGALSEELAALHGVASDGILLGNGSSEPLELAVAAFCSPTQPAVVAEPTFEVVWMHAKAVGDKAIVVPLTKDHHHDLPRMEAAARPAGLIYLCNPNNPTGTITPKAEVRAFLARVPKETVVLVDEAYHHYAESADYESVVPLVREHPNLLVLRTFSKIYGLAGMRCGYAVAAPQLLERLHQHQAFNNLNIAAVAGARAGLKDSDHVAHCKEQNHAVRTAALADLESQGYRALPSQANFFLFDLHRPAAPIIRALRDRGIAVGRPFQAVPTHLRVSVGTPEQMQAFAAAFREVMRG